MRLCTKSPFKARVCLPSHLHPGGYFVSGDTPDPDWKPPVSRTFLWFGANPLYAASHLRAVDAATRRRDALGEFAGMGLRPAKGNGWDIARRVYSSSGYSV